MQIMARENYSLDKMRQFHLFKTNSSQDTIIPRETH